jgi:hypothetical protein
MTIRRPPAEQSPPVLLDLDYTAGEGLVVTSPQPGSATGQAFDARSLRDCTIDAELGLLGGADEDRYGLFFRQGAADRYVACTVSAAGHLAVGLVDGGPPLIVTSGPLSADIPFERGIGVTNRLTVVACGPVAAIVLNGMAVAGVALDPRYVAGPAGALLIHTGPQQDARLTVRWAQARAILADQPDSGT